MRKLLAFVLLFCGGNLFAATPPAGIPRELARQRATQLSGIRYHLHFTLVPHAASALAHEDLSFQSKSASSVLLDFREGSISSLHLNGTAVQPILENGHIELPAGSVRAGENTVSVDFAAPVAPANKAITRFEDKDDNTEYLYTLFVPMDAEMGFPCFDQPDLKARFQLELDAPDRWTVISNSPVVSQADVSADQRHTVFSETEPISTYLFAFAAGPFREIQGAHGQPNLYVRQSQFKKAEAEAPEVQRVTGQGIAYLANYFAQPFPFPKYDLILIPGFAYGGMEHAGATFLREESVLFRTAPTHSDHLNRDILLLHELTHQWFGDFTTMRWFDDLWLKEGFAQYMAYQALAALQPGDNIWKRFSLSIKPAAYSIDSTKGTTPIYQDIGNLKDAKSAYGAIVYSKAPGVLKQLAFVLGEENFRDGLRLYLKDHPYGNAEWSDLVAAFERVSGMHLQHWAEMWIRHRGMPQLDVDWTCNGAGRLASFRLTQRDVLGEGGVWPIAMQVLLAYADGPPIRLRAQLDSPNENLTAAENKPCPAYVFLNDQDYAYGRFLLDSRSRQAVISRLGQVHDVFERSLLWGSLWDSVREAEMAPRDFLDLELRLLPEETDEQLAQSLAGHLTTGLHRYVSDSVRAEFSQRAEMLATDRMLHSESQDFRIIWFRTLRAIAESSYGRAQLKELLSGQLTIPGVALRPLDRWTMVTALVALHDEDADSVLSVEEAHDHSGDGLKYDFVAKAARPDAATKQHYFNQFLHDSNLPEDWISQSLGAFNYWNQSRLTLPYLKLALDALPQVKRDRKIFFLLGWLNAFIGGQQSPAAQAQVQEFLSDTSLDPDLRLKILEVSDELDRTVKIRKQFP
ncbi:MAG TPA: M1 family aminopeptidase [Candidatus Acidoferrum sp.]|nr:M1 family aminopeptidase [Candidatus Acidoferrum sp.]